MFISNVTTKQGNHRVLEKDTTLSSEIRSHRLVRFTALALLCALFIFGGITHKAEASTGWKWINIGRMCTRGAYYYLSGTGPAAVYFYYKSSSSSSLQYVQGVRVDLGVGKSVRVTSPIPGFYVYAVGGTDRGNLMTWGPAGCL